MKYLETGIKRSDAKRKLLVTVDDEDYALLEKLNWQVSKDNCVSTHSKVNNNRLIHRIIMNASADQEIDHIDGNRLNNQKSNLRFVTSSQNKMNRGARSDSKSGYKGVSWHKQRNRWTSRIMVDGKYKYLGLFTDIKEAIRAYNDCAIKHYGGYAWTNPL